MKQLGILVVVLVLGLCAPAPAALADTSEAERAFARARQLFKERSYLEAIKAFEEAYRHRPHFFVQCSIARCYQNMNNYLEAAEHYKRCLDEGAGEDKIGERVRKSLAKVEARLASVEVRSPGGGGMIHVDGRPVRAAPATIQVNPGSRVIEVRREGARPASATIQCTAGGSHEVTLSPEAVPAATREVTTRKEAPPPTGREGLHQAWFWTTAAVTAALAVTYAVMGASTKSAHTAYYDDPTEEGYNTFTGRKTVTNVFFGLAVAAAATTTVLFFFTDFGGGDEPAGERATSLGLGLRGTF
jgi:hypothetical protein